MRVLLKFLKVFQLLSNVFLSRYNNLVDNLLKNGVYIDELENNIKVKCHILIADAPERALALDRNGTNSCIAAR